LGVVDVGRSLGGIVCRRGINMSVANLGADESTDTGEFG